MGTMAYSKVNYTGIDSTGAIALVLARSMGHRTDAWPYVKDISELFFKLRQKGFRLRDFGLRRIPDGYYSDDVENFVGQLLSMGYATQRSPIKLAEAGVHLCDEIVAKESETNKTELEKLMKAVDELLSKAQVTA
jgi:hypothetical protein